MISTRATPAPTLSVEAVQARIRPRPIDGISALLLPYRSGGRPGADAQPDWASYVESLERTASAGLTPAVNMDTGYVHLLTPAERAEVLRVAARTLRGRPFVAGAFIAGQHDDAPGADDRPTDLVARYCREAEAIRAAGGTPIVFPSPATHDVVPAYERIAEAVDRFYGFELSPVFHPDGRIWDLDTYKAVLDIPQCAGAKHSSLHRQPEWDRLALRDAHRPDFLVLTGNDLAIDMVMWGSDYLLGLSTFAPDLFARRDALWAKGDDAFHELNDALQDLGNLAFRPPVPAYRHSAAMFLKLRGWLDTDDVPDAQVRRPESDRDILRTILDRLESL